MPLNIVRTLENGDEEIVASVDGAFDEASLGDLMAKPFGLTALQSAARAALQDAIVAYYLEHGRTQVAHRLELA